MTFYKDALDCLKKLSKVLPEFGVTLEILESGDDYDSIRLSKPDCEHKRVYYSKEHDNFYCCKCNHGMGNEYYNEHKNNRMHYPE